MCSCGPVHRGERQLQGYHLASQENDLPEPGRMPGHVTKKRGEHRWKPNGRRSVLGESVTEGTVSRWLKAVGEIVEVDEPLLEEQRLPRRKY